MDPKDIKTTIREFMSKSFSTADLKDGEDIFSRGFVNSLFAMQLVMFVEQQFAITVEDDDLDLDNFRSIDAIAGFIQQKK